MQEHTQYIQRMQQTHTCSSVCTVSLKAPVKVTHPGAESQVSTAKEPQPATYCIPLYEQRKSGRGRNKERGWGRMVGGEKKKGEWESEKERLLKTSAESVMPAMAEKGKEEKGRGRESSRGRAGEKRSEMNTPLKRETLCVGLTQILRATQTYSSDAPRPTAQTHPDLQLRRALHASLLIDSSTLSDMHVSVITTLILILTWTFFFLPRVGNLNLFESVDPIHGII